MLRNLPASNYAVGPNTESETEGDLRRRGTGVAFWIGLLVLLLLVSTAAVADEMVPGGSFVDDDGNVHEGFIEAIATADITRGCNPPSNYFYCPTDSVTRGQMAAFLVRAVGIAASNRDSFSDDDGSVFESDINALAAAGIARGCDPPDNERFCPDDSVTRGQMAAFLVRAFEYSDGAGSDLFDDDDGSIFEADIDRLATAGVTKGCSPPTNDRYCPDDVIRRDQMASFLGRALGLEPIAPPPPGKRMVISEDTTITDERLMLRRGDSIEFRNGARLMIGEGASVDWQGTPTSTWSDDGRVQNLVRDVKIFGRGDIMFMTGSKASTIRYVEIDLQPKTDVNHYPLHWHFVGDGSRGTLVEGVVVKNSTNRAFVPHASHGITFRETIARNIAGEAYWWNEPPDHFDYSNNSEDILYDRILADGIHNGPEDERGFNLGAIELGAGLRNEIRDSVARNIDPSHKKNCSGFKWPSHSIHQPGVWVAENLKTFGSKCHGIHVWQNTKQPHIVDGFESTEGISHGAYNSTYEYRNVDVPYVIIHAVNWSVEGGKIGEVRAAKHQSDGPVSFIDVEIDRLVVDNDRGSDPKPGRYVFRNTGLDCSDVVWASVAPGTIVTIDGVRCPVP
jgi:hypothetical protein